MLGMMIPTPSISRNSVRKRIASARLSSTAPPVPTQRSPMIGTPYREVNHGGAGRNLHARHESASLRDAPLGSPRAAHRAETRAAGPRRSVSHGRARKFRPARSIDRRVTGRSTADHMYQKRIDGVVESGGPSL